MINIYFKTSSDTEPLKTGDAMQNVGIIAIYGVAMDNDPGGDDVAI